MIRKIADVPMNTMQQDLEKYRKKAIDLGATDAKIITADMVQIEDRVRAKCIYPKCDNYGTSANCPPYVMPVDDVRKIVKEFHYAIFFNIKVDPEEVVGAQASQKLAPQRSGLKVHEIVSKIESEAFYDGHFLALGFGAGPCKRAFCPNNECAALVPGQACRHPLKARASVEAMGINALGMAKQVGWEVYPIGRSAIPDDVPFATRLGLVLIS